MRYSLAAAAMATTVAAMAALPAAAATFSGYDINLVGTSVIIGSDLQLTDVNGGHGAAWFTSALSTSNSFAFTFSFSLAKGNFDPMADGISFALQANGTNVIGGGGGGIGYTGLGAVGSIVQTWDNNRVGLNTTGEPIPNQNAYLTTTAAPANLGAASLVTGTQTVRYNATTQLLSMNGTLNVDGTAYSFNDAATIDLAARFGQTMYAGFTGSTGLSQADQRITGFAVAAVPEPESYALLLVGLGVICWATRRGNHPAKAAAGTSPAES